MSTKKQIAEAKEINLRELIMENIEHFGDKMVRALDHVKICCPFHNERTPSMAVYDDHYHCFSCGAHGDQIDWVMKTMEVEFSEAVKLLLQT